MSSNQFLGVSLNNGFYKSKVKYLVDKSKYYQIGDGDHGSINPSDYTDKGIPYLRVQNLTFSGILNKKGLVYISKETHQKNKKSKIIPNDLLIAKTGSVGKLCLMTLDIPESNTTSSVSKITFDQKKFLPKYFLYYFQSSYIQDLIKEISFQKSAQPGFNIDDLVDFPVTYPNLDQQKLISLFLDKKINQIDSVIQKSQKKINLLKEQNTCLINQYITKGLDSNVEMKDSGIEWIGKIPKHWKLIKLKYVSDVTLGKMLTPNDKGSMSFQNYLRSFNVQEDFLNLDDVKKMWFSNNEFKKLSIKSGDILVNEGGQVGRPCFIQEDLQGYGFQNSINRIRTSIMNNYYLYLQVLLSFKVSYYDSIVDRVSIPHLTKEKLENISVIAPLIQEQKKICDLILEKTNYYSQIIKKEIIRIDLLFEYRKSLISNVVMGTTRITKEML